MKFLICLLLFDGVLDLFVVILGSSFIDREGSAGRYDAIKLCIYVGHQRQLHCRNHEKGEKNTPNSYYLLFCTVMHVSDFI